MFQQREYGRYAACAFGEHPGRNRERSHPPPAAIRHPLREGIVSSFFAFSFTIDRDIYNVVKNPTNFGNQTISLFLIQLVQQSGEIMPFFIEQRGKPSPFSMREISKAVRTEA